MGRRHGFEPAAGDPIASLSGIAIVVVFLLLAGLMIARKLPALLAVPLMAMAMAALAGVPLVHLAVPSDDPKFAHDLASVVTLGAVKLAPVYATLFFGALLSRVVLSTGIAETLVTYAAEFGGDKPLVLSLLLCAVVAILFTTVTGLGAIIMIGTIVLPVLMTVGVPRATSATLFLLAFGLGYILNIAQWKFYSTIFGVDRTTFQSYAFVIFAVQAVVLVVYAIVRARATRDYAAKVIPAAAEDTPRKRVGPLALITPLLPLVLLRGFGVDAIVGFALAALYGVLVTRPRDAVKTLIAAWIRGIEDVAPATILMIGIGMLLVAANTPQVQAAVTPLVAAVAPRSPLAYVVLFGLLSPLALYRGPLNPYGVGIGVYTVLATLHVLPPVALVAAVMAVVQVQNVCDPTNTQNVWVANFTGTGVERITRLLLPWQVGVATVAAIVVVVFGGALFGKAPFPPRAAAAATLNTGLFAPPSAARALAVLDDGTPDGALAAHEVAATVARGWPGYRIVDAHGEPSASDCSTKPYAAAMRLTVTQLGRDGRDIGLELFDCAGWSVDQWHSQGAIHTAALDALFRVRVWSREHPSLAAEVFERGLAFDPADPRPTYFYVLFKPVDGYMRALVRPGGPAYAAGLRTGDVIDKLDGRFWWEYGTYQTQLRAYDGKPHDFDVERGTVGGPPAHVQLGEAFTGDAPRTTAIAWADCNYGFESLPAPALTAYLLTSDGVVMHTHAGSVYSENMQTESAVIGPKRFRAIAEAIDHAFFDPQPATDPTPRPTPMPGGLQPIGPMHTTDTRNARFAVRYASEWTDWRIPNHDYTKPQREAVRSAYAAAYDKNLLWRPIAPRANAFAVCIPGAPRDLMAIPKSASTPKQ